MQENDPPYLTVGTEVSAKYKGAFCEAKIRKVVRVVKCKVTFKSGLGSTLLSDDQIKGSLRVGANVEARHPDKNAYIEAVINKIQDCSQYTVVFDDGDITTLRRSALCLKSGRHFNESETLDQLPLTHPEHFSSPVVGGRRNVRRRRDPITGEGGDGEESSDDETLPPSKKGKRPFNQDESDVDIGKVVCVEITDKKKGKDTWFPGVIVSPQAQETVKIRTKDEYLVRSFKDGRYYTVPKKEITSFSKDSHAGKNDSNSNVLKLAIDKAVQFIDRNELPAHWDKDVLFTAADEPLEEIDEAEASESEESETDLQTEEKDRFVAQLYKYMDDRGTPINKVPIVCNRDLDLYRLYKIVVGRGGYNKVTNSSQWKSVTVKMGFGAMPSTSTINLVKQGYKKFIHNFEEFNRKMGGNLNTLYPSGAPSTSSRSNRCIFRDRHASSSSKELKKEEPKVPPKEIKEEEVVQKPVEEEIVEPPAPLAPSPPLLAPPPPPPPLVSPEEPKKLPEPIVTPEEPPRRSRSRQESRKKREAEAAVTAVADSLEKETKTAVEKITSKAAPVKKRRSVKEKEVEKEPVNEELPTQSIPTPPLPSSTPPPVIGAPVKRGTGRGKYKRKTEREEPTEPEIRVEEYPDRECIGRDVQVQVGDKLSVYYGKESEGKKYEAKVVDINEKQELFFVHYAGWNNRYDEWIPRIRVAENLSLRSEQVTSVPQGRGPFQSSVSDGGGTSNSDSGSTLKGPTVTKGIRKKLKPYTTTPMSTTRSKSAVPIPRKRLSSEGDAHATTSKKKNRKRGTLSGGESAGESSGSEGKTKSPKRIRKPKKIYEPESGCSESLVTSSWSKSLPSPDISDYSKDPIEKAEDQVIDLNQLRSEMKGIDKMVTAIPVSLISTPRPVSPQPEPKSDIYDFEEETLTPISNFPLPISPEKKEVEDESQEESTGEEIEVLKSPMTMVEKAKTEVTNQDPPKEIEEESAKLELVTTVLPEKEIPSLIPVSETVSNNIAVAEITTLITAATQKIIGVPDVTVFKVNPEFHPTIPHLFVRGLPPVIPGPPLSSTLTPIGIPVQRAQRPPPILIPTVTPTDTFVSTRFIIPPLSQLPSQSTPLPTTPSKIEPEPIKPVEAEPIQNSSRAPILPEQLRISVTPRMTLVTLPSRRMGSPILLPNFRDLVPKSSIRGKLGERGKFSSPFSTTPRVRTPGGMRLPIRPPDLTPISKFSSPIAMTSGALAVGLKKKRKVKSQQFVESSGSSDEAGERRQLKQKQTTPKKTLILPATPQVQAITTQIVTPVSVVGPITGSVAIPLTFALTRPPTPRKPPPQSKVAPVLKLKLASEKSSIQLPTKSGPLKRLARIESPLKFTAKEIVLPPVKVWTTTAQSPVIPKKVQQTNVPLIPKLNKLKALVVSDGVKEEETIPSAAAITTVLVVIPPTITNSTTIVLTEPEKEEEKTELPLLLLPKVEPERNDELAQALTEELKVEIIKNEPVKETNESEKDENSSAEIIPMMISFTEVKPVEIVDEPMVIPTTPPKSPPMEVSIAEDESCHSLLCEEEIPGSPTPGTSDFKSFSFEDEKPTDTELPSLSSPFKTMSMKSNLGESLSGSSSLIGGISSHVLKTIEEVINQGPLPEPIVDIPSLPNVKEFEIFAEAKALPVITFQTREETVENPQTELIDMGPREPMGLVPHKYTREEPAEDSPCGTLSSSSISSGSPRGGDGERHSGSGENSKSKEPSDTDSVDCLPKTGDGDMADENSSSDETGRKYSEGSSRSRRGKSPDGRSRSPVSPRKRRPGRRSSPDESLRPYRGNRTSSIRRPTGMETELGLGRMPPPNHPLVALGKPPKSEKFNFIPELNDSMSQDERVATVQASLDSLREKYKELKTELTALDKKKKRIRKRERERAKREQEAMRVAGI